MRRETPPDWCTLMEARGLYSIRALARGLDIAAETASRLVHGGASSAETIEAAAMLLKVSPDRIRAIRGEIAVSPFSLPRGADALTRRQRDAVLAVVRAMLDPVAAGVDEDLDELGRVPPAETTTQQVHPVAHD